MEKTVSATEAKTHLGSLMRRAAEQGETIIVERSGIPQIAIVPISEFERMKGGRKDSGEKIALQRIRSLKKNLHERLSQERSKLTDIAELINHLREERDGEIIDGLR